MVFKGKIKTPPASFYKGENGHLLFWVLNPPEQLLLRACQTTRA